MYDMAVQPACPICASPTREVLRPAAGLSGAVTVVRCTSCRYIYRAIGTQPQAEWPPAIFDNPDENWAERLGAIEKAVGRGALLNLGASAPLFLQLAREEGWQVADAAFAGADHEAPSEGVWPAGSFDAVTLWSLLEYSRHPAELIGLAAHYCRVDGVLAIGLLNAERIAEWWPASHADHAQHPLLLRLFTPIALQRYLGRFGFRIERHVTDHAASLALIARYVP